MRYIKRSFFRVVDEIDGKKLQGKIAIVPDRRKRNRQKLLFPACGRGSHSPSCRRKRNQRESNGSREFPDITEEDWDRLIDISQKGTFFRPDTVVLQSRKKTAPEKEAVHHFVTDLFGD